MSKKFYVEHRRGDPFLRRTTQPGRCNIPGFSVTLDLLVFEPWLLGSKLGTKGDDRYTGVCSVKWRDSNGIPNPDRATDRLSSMSYYYQQSLGLRPRSGGGSRQRTDSKIEGKDS